MWKYKHNIQTEIEDTPGGSTISMSALGNTSHTTQTKNPKHCEILIKRILFKGEILQLYRNKFQNVFSPMRQISNRLCSKLVSFSGLFVPIDRCIFTTLKMYFHLWGRFLNRRCSKLVSFSGSLPSPSPPATVLTPYSYIECSSFFLLFLGFEYMRWSMQWWKKD